VTTCPTVTFSTKPSFGSNPVTHIFKTNLTWLTRIFKDSVFPSTKHTSLCAATTLQIVYSVTESVHRIHRSALSSRNVVELICNLIYAGNKSAIFFSTIFTAYCVQIWWTKLHPNRKINLETTDRYREAVAHCRGRRRCAETSFTNNSIKWGINSCLEWDTNPQFHCARV